MKPDGEIMEILEAYDHTQSFRAAAVLAGCSHHTVAKHVAARDAGRPLAEPVAREKCTDEYLPKIEELVEKTRGRIRADVAHQKLVGMGFEGSERSFNTPCDGSDFPDAGLTVRLDHSALAMWPWCDDSAVR